MLEKVLVLPGVEFQWLVVEFAEEAPPGVLERAVGQAVGPAEEQREAHEEHEEQLEDEAVVVGTNRSLQRRHWTQRWIIIMEQLRLI